MEPRKPIFPGNTAASEETGASRSGTRTVHQPTIKLIAD
jgi:hypothetical protein